MTVSGGRAHQAESEQAPLFFVPLRAQQRMTGETATMDFHRAWLEARRGIRVEELVPESDAGSGTSTLGRAALGHLTRVRRALRRAPGARAIWFVPSAGQLPIVGWAMRGLENPAAAIIEGASFLPHGDWQAALRRMPLFFLTRGLVNSEPLGRLMHLGRILPVAAASRWQLSRIRSIVPSARTFWLPNGSPGMPMKQLWSPPDAPSLRVIGHGMFYKGTDLVLDVGGLLTEKKPNLTVDWAVRAQPSRRAERPSRPYVRLHDRVDPFAFLAGGSLALVPLRVSSGTNVYPNVIIEAMSAGVPLLASDLPAHRELLGPVADEATVRGFSPADWAARAHGLLDDPARLSRLSEALLSQARRLWHPDSVDERWDALLGAMSAPSPHVPDP